MAFTGYIFHSREEILPYVEELHQGLTYSWCFHQSRRLNCHVLCGFPEKDNDILYNSFMIVDPQGIVVAQGQKVNKLTQPYPS